MELPEGFVNAIRGHVECLRPGESGPVSTAKFLCTLITFVIIIINNNNDFFWANILKDQAQWREKPRV